MSAHQPFDAAARRAEDGAPEQPPTMTELLAACAAASAVSTPPDTTAPDTTAPARPDEPAGETAPTSTEGREAA
ncbi:hypothetical protein [Streptomyces sp. NPDC048650]|uniref:hypothetical protein n=1 Tax=unclassified Streptomyces TaxID=2593676 RepID=UPI003720AA69